MSQRLYAMVMAVGVAGSSLAMAEVPFPDALKDANVILNSISNGQTESLMLGNGDLYGIVWEKDTSPVASIRMGFGVGKGTGALRSAGSVTHHLHSVEESKHLVTLEADTAIIGKTAKGLLAAGVGLAAVLAIVLIGHTVTVPTALAIAEIATQLAVVNVHYDERLFDIVGVTPGEPGYDTPEQNVGSEIWQQVQSIEVARLFEQASSDLTAATAADAVVAAMATGVASSGRCLRTLSRASPRWRMT